MNLQFLALALVIYNSSVFGKALDISNINSDIIENNENNKNSMSETIIKREEEVPNYGILDDDEEEDEGYNVLNDAIPWNDDQTKRSRGFGIKTASDTMKTCMLYVNQLLNLICDTDNWMATSLYKNSDKRKIKMRCCLSPCSMISLKMHCKRRTESDSQHRLTPMAMLLRSDVAERLPILPKDNNEIEEAKYSITPNGFFGAFHP